MYCLTVCRCRSQQAELPPQDDQSRWHPPADDKDNGSFFEGFRAYRGDAVAAVAAAAAAATSAPASTVTSAPAEDGSVATEERVDGGGDGDSGPPQKVGATGAEGLAFHHFPIPDLSPAENTEFLARLVDQLESLVASGKVGGTKFGGLVLVGFVLRPEGCGLEWGWIGFGHWQSWCSLAFHS